MEVTDGRSQNLSRQGNLPGTGTPVTDHLGRHTDEDVVQVVDSSRGALRIQAPLTLKAAVAAVLAVWLAAVILLWRARCIRQFSRHAAHCDWHRRRDAAHRVFRCILAVGRLPAIRNQRRHSAHRRDRGGAGPGLGSSASMHTACCLEFCLARRPGRYGDRFHRATGCARSGSPAQLRGQPTLRDVEFAGNPGSGSGRQQRALIQSQTTGAAGEATVAPMVLLPLLLIPAYLVPLFIMLHVTALIQGATCGFDRTELGTCMH